MKSELSVIIVCDSIIIRNSSYPPSLPFSLYNFVVTLYNNVNGEKTPKKKERNNQVSVRTTTDFFLSNEFPHLVPLRLSSNWLLPEDEEFGHSKQNGSLFRISPMKYISFICRNNKERTGVH